jgi:general stress protein 26
VSYNSDKIVEEIVMIIDFDSLIKEFIIALAKEPSIILATSLNDEVTARTMSHVNDGLDIYFQTSNTSRKFKQIESNPRIALAVGNMQIEAFTEIIGHPSRNLHFVDLYKTKFPRYYELYSNIADEVVVKAIPVKVTFYKYIDDKPFKDTLDLKLKRAYRE